jgi:hypothetical protein
MTDPRGPVVVGMDPHAANSPALDVAAAEAVRRRVELRLVYGHASLPSALAQTCESLERTITAIQAAHPSLAVTTAIFPGTAANAVITASGHAGLVVLAYRDNDLLASLTSVSRTPVIVVVPEPVGAH